MCTHSGCDASLQQIYHLYVHCGQAEAVVRKLGASLKSTIYAHGKHKIDNISLGIGVYVVSLIQKSLKLGG